MNTRFLLAAAAVAVTAAALVGCSAAPHPSTKPVAATTAPAAVASAAATPAADTDAAYLDKVHALGGPLANLTKDKVQQFASGLCTAFTKIQAGGQMGDLYEGVLMKSLTISQATAHQLLIDTVSQYCPDQMSKVPAS